MSSPRPSSFLCSFAASAAILLSFLSVGQLQAAPKKYALLVGVNEYEHRNLDALTWAVNDAAEMRDVLAKEGYKVVLLTADEAAARKDNSFVPTRTNIRQQLVKLIKNFAKGDTLVIGLAGHGLQFNGDDDGYFCPFDARPFPGRTDTLVSVKWIYDRLKEDAAEGVKLVLVDACRTLQTKGERGINTGDALKPPDGIGVLLSCKAGQTSREIDKYKHGVFFYHVLEGLKGKAKDKKGNVTWDSLRSYVKEEVTLEEENQTPEEAGRLAGIPPVLVATKKLTTDPGAAVIEPTRPFSNSVGMEFVYIKEGTFLMGSQEERGRSNDETQHRVTLKKGFHLQTTLVTQKQWKAIMGEDNNPSRFKGDDLPVDSVSWDDAKAFCRKLSARDGRAYRLPYEAEWEYAARAGKTTPFWQGETITTEQVNFNGDYPYQEKDAKGVNRRKTTPVKQFKANPWGLHDMGGNLHQWCEDWYGDYPKGAVDDPKGPRDGMLRVLRGGSWDDVAEICRAAYRLGYDPTGRDGNLGFRVALRQD